MGKELKKIAKSRALKVIEDDEQPIPHNAEWSIKGELALSCSCELFCPCVISLGQHPPTHGFCHAWIAARIDKGRYGATKLNGLNICMLVDIPGKMGAGNWTVALYIDDTANDAQFAAMEQIFTARPGGPQGFSGCWSVITSALVARWWITRPRARCVALQPAKRCSARLRRSPAPRKITM